MLRFIRLTVCMGVLGTTFASAGDWPSVRGPRLDGHAEAQGAIEGGGVGLEPAWTTPIGSGYSGVVVADGRAVTMFTDGAVDWVAAFDAETGRELWRARLSDATVGHDGSDDGPLSSPVIGRGKVYALGSTGRLVALRLKDGKSGWEVELTEELAGKAPFFGFTTTPILVGHTLVVQTGADNGQSIVGLNARNGKRIWAHGDDAVDYQSPAVMTLAGRSQIVAVSKRKITGLAAASGEPLWVHELGEDERASSANPTYIGDDRFAVEIGGKLTAYRVSATSDGFSIEQAFRSEALGGSYAPPVLHEGHLYGFRGQVLTCVDASNGERVWRSRPPGGDGLIVVDGHLVIFGSNGNVVIAAATPDGYAEVARRKVLAGSSLTWPGFADGRIFVRNLDQLAAVAVTHQADSAAGAVASAERTDDAFGRFIGELEDSNDPQSRVDGFFAGRELGPVVDGDYVHFVFRSTADDVSIAGSMLDNEVAVAMTRVEGTDLYYSSFELEPGGRWEYRFQVDFDDWVPDPLNSRTVPAVDGEDLFSELVTPGYEMLAFLDEASGPRGRLDSFTLESDALGYEKEITVWLPPGYDDSEVRYPVLLVNDGAAWLEKGLMANALDNLSGAAVEPILVVFVPSDRRWWLEAGGSRTGDYVRMQAEELLPALAERYRVADSPAPHGVLGSGFYGVSSAYAALKYPDLFGKAAVQSTYLGLGVGDELATMIESGVGATVRFYLDWNRYDDRRVDRGYDFADDSRRLAQLLEDGGYEMEGGEILDSRGWGGWRNRADRILVSLFPAD